MNFLFSIGFCLLLINSPLANAWCTPECECSIITGIRTLNHAKCTDISSLLEGKNIPIHSLDISNTNLTKLPHLEKLRNLIILNASNNLLSDIDHLGKRIKTLDLSHNKITSAKLENIPSHIENLDLSYNEITYLPLELTKLSELKSIEVIGNAINCTCESIQVRNWMQTQVVWTDNHIKCSYPISVKGMPWLQVKESVVCGRQMGSKHEDEINNDENELMMGDQPMEGSAETEVNEELGRDYLPVNKKHLNEDDLIEGSGDSTNKMERLESSQPKNQSSHEEEEEEEGSGGSGFGPIPVIHLEETSEDNIEDSSSTSSSTVFVPLGVYEGDKKISSTTDQPEQQEEVTEELIVPDHISNVNEIHNEEEHETEQTADEEEENVPADVISSGDDGITNAKISEANTGGQNTGTHILLGVIALLVICLVVFVVFKKMSKRNQSHDVENPRATELKDMDRKNLGKPLHKNGNNGVHEHKPLIGNNDKPLNGKIVPYNDADKNIQQPLLHKQPNNEENPESNNNIETPVPTVRQSLANSPNSNQPPVSPRTTSRYGPYPPPKSPRTPSSPSSDDESFQPSSPSQRRYSPVYSPETGKVKIKLSETPKPKTPMLVTRSRSNAGEIVTTPTNLEERITMPTGQN